MPAEVWCIVGLVVFCAAWGWFWAVGVDRLEDWSDRHDRRRGDR